MRKAKYKAVPVIILLALLFIYLILLFKITIFRDFHSRVRSVNMIPFITIAEYTRSILHGNKIIAISNILGNLIIFVPLGYMSALLLPQMRRPTRILILAASFSVGLEVLQYIFACGATDIDDVILNALGGVAGYWIYAFISRCFNSKKYAIFISASMIALTCIGFVTFNNYRFLLPMAGDIPARAERRNEDSRKPLTIEEQYVVLPHTGAEADDFQSESDKTEWRLILVNKWSCVPDDYKVELTEFANGQLVFLFSAYYKRAAK